MKVGQVICTPENSRSPFAAGWTGGMVLDGLLTPHGGGEKDDYTKSTGACWDLNSLPCDYGKRTSLTCTSGATIPDDRCYFSSTNPATELIICLLPILYTITVCFYSFLFYFTFYP